MIDIQNGEHEDADDAQPPASALLHAPTGPRMFWSRDRDKNPKVNVLLAGEQIKGMPRFDGHIGNQRVYGYIRRGAGGAFIAFVEPIAGVNGLNKQIAKGNLSAHPSGNLRIRLEMDDKTIHDKPFYATVSVDMPIEILHDMGFDPARLKPRG